MKNILFSLVSVLALLFAGNVSGQQFEFIPDSTDGIGTPNAENKFEGPITNLWDQENKIEWIKHEDLPDGWSVQICQYTLTCWMDWILSDTIVLPPDGADKLQVKFFTNETEGVGSVTIDLTPVSNPDLHESWTFTLALGENDVQNNKPSSRNRIGLSFDMKSNFGMNYNASLTSPKDTHAKLVMYDVKGRNAGTIWSGHLNAGENAISFKPEAHYTGVYFIRLEAFDIGSVTQRVILLH
ncbi:MAG: hypothetical protein HN590_14550 [Calditrichaeota bacterium]|nr:hypothetical protein [Calditrichota bacterium]